MSNLLRVLLESFLFVAGAFILLSTASWMDDKDGHVEEVFSRLEECEKNDELKK